MYLEFENTLFRVDKEFLIIRISVILHVVNRAINFIMGKCTSDVIKQQTDAFR